MTAAVTSENAEPAAAAKAQRVGVLLVNLGTPDTADAKGVRVYLKEFLSDPRVIEDQGLLWKLALNGVILRVRPRRKARDYRKIWNTGKDESPLKTITRAQAEKLAAAIADHGQVVVDWAMRYGNPSIASRIAALTAQGCDRLLVVPLYPQYSAATTATVYDKVFRVLAGMRAQPTLRVTPPYYDDPDYIEALAVSINAHLASLPFQPEVIVASFHGMPQQYVDKGDPYLVQCTATIERLRKAAGPRCRKAAAHLPVALRLRRVAANPIPTRPWSDWRKTACAASRSSCPVSPPIAWRRWRRSRRRTPRSSGTMAASNLRISPA